MKYPFFLFLALLIVGPIKGQMVIHGRVLSVYDKMPIAYVNIGFSEKALGTVSDTNGLFSLTIPEDMLTHDLKISHIGFETSHIKVGNNQKDTVRIHLEPKVVELRSFDVLPNETILLGKLESDSLKGFFNAQSLGAEAGTKITLTEETQVTGFALNVLKCDFERMKFRVNFYRAKGKRVGERLNPSDYFLELRKGDSGKISSTFDRPLNLSGAIYCTMELIELVSLNESNELWFLATTENKGQTIRRLASQAKWEYFKGYSLNFVLIGRR